MNSIAAALLENIMYYCILKIYFIYGSKYYKKQIDLRSASWNLVVVQYLKKGVMAKKESDMWSQSDVNKMQPWYRRRIWQSNKSNLCIFIWSPYGSTSWKAFHRETLWRFPDEYEIEATGPYIRRHDKEATRTTS